jgi:hypothetical protein
VRRLPYPSCCPCSNDAFPASCSRKNGNGAYASWYPVMDDCWDAMRRCVARCAPIPAACYSFVFPDPYRPPDFLARFFKVIMKTVRYGNAEQQRGSRKKTQAAATPHPGLFSQARRTPVRRLLTRESNHHGAHLEGTCLIAVMRAR